VEIRHERRRDVEVLRLEDRDQALGPEAIGAAVVEVKMMVAGVPAVIGPAPEGRQLDLERRLLARAHAYRGRGRGGRKPAHGFDPSLSRGGFDRENAW
jgi:hypothetical protein